MIDFTKHSREEAIGRGLLLGALLGLFALGLMALACTL